MEKKLQNNDFLNKIRISKKSQEIIRLKEKYEANEIFEGDLSIDEIKQLLKLYENEEKEIDQDIAARKAHIKGMLKQKGK